MIIINSRIETAHKKTMMPPNTNLFSCRTRSLKIRTSSTLLFAVVAIQIYASLISHRYEASMKIHVQSTISKHIGVGDNDATRPNLKQKVGKDIIGHAAVISSISETEEEADSTKSNMAKQGNAIFHSSTKQIGGDDNDAAQPDLIQKDGKDILGHAPVISLLPETEEKTDSKKFDVKKLGNEILHNPTSILAKDKSLTPVDHSEDGSGGSLPPPRLCRILTNEVHKPKTPINEPIGVPYQCAGPSYDYFSKNLLKVVSNPEKYGKDPLNWGRRNLPMPPNKSVLIFGNSHTRQVFQSLMCQYKSEIIDATQTLRLDGKGNGIWKILLHQNVTVFGAFNIPHVYSTGWMGLLAASLNRSIDSFDALVLGRFNTFNDSRKTSFEKLMKSLTAGTDVDFERIMPPGMDAVARVYSGNILAVSMFAARDNERHQDVIKKIKVLQEGGRRNIIPIDGRQYVPYIGECATDVSDTVGVCSKDFKSKKNRGVDGHRCVGKNGGHPDLIAWDIIEECFRLG